MLKTSFAENVALLKTSCIHQKPFWWYRLSQPIGDSYSQNRSHPGGPRVAWVHLHCWNRRLRDGMRPGRFPPRFYLQKWLRRRYFTVDRFSRRPTRSTIMPLFAGISVLFLERLFFSFAQWQYRKRWGLSELRLLLIENYTQYPAMRTWNTVHIGNFWRRLRSPRLPKTSNLKPAACLWPSVACVQKKLSRKSTKSSIIHSYMLKITWFCPHFQLLESTFCLAHPLYPKIPLETSSRFDDPSFRNYVKTMNRRRWAWKKIEKQGAIGSRETWDAWFVGTT